MVGNTQQQFNDRLLSANLIYPQVQAFLEGQLYAALIESFSKEHTREMPVQFSQLKKSLRCMNAKSS